MAEEREFQTGDFVWVTSKWEGPHPVVGRVIRRMGSQYHVSWTSCDNNLFDQFFDADELTPCVFPQPPRAARGGKAPRATE